MTHSNKDQPLNTNGLAVSGRIVEITDESPSPEFTEIDFVPEARKPQCCAHRGPDYLCIAPLNFVDIKLASRQSPQSFITPAVQEQMSENDGTSVANAQLNGPSLLPSIGLVNKQGSAYRVTDPDHLPEAWFWALPALHKLREELAPTGNQAIDSLKDKLVRVFSQNGGELIVTEGRSRLSALYPVRADNQHLFEPAGLASSFRKVAAWLIERAIRPSTPATAEFLFMCQNPEHPIFRIDVRAPLYTTHPLLTRTNLARNASESAGDHILFESPLIHELTHAAIEAGNLLSGRETTSRTGSNLNSKNRIVNTYVFQSFYILEPSFFRNSIPKVIDTCPYQHNEKLEETLTFAVANYCGDGRQTPSPLLDRFITDVFSRDLDLILAGDREGRRAFLDSLNSPKQDVFIQGCLRKGYGPAQENKQSTAQEERSEMRPSYQPV